MKDDKVKLSEIRKACAGATEGPWEANAESRIYGNRRRIISANTGATCKWEDAEFIAMARTALPALLSGLDALTKWTKEDCDYSALRAFDAGLEAAGIEVDE